MNITIKEFDIPGTISWYLQTEHRSVYAPWGVTTPTIENVKKFLHSQGIDTVHECWHVAVTPAQVITKPTPSILKTGEVIATATVKKYILGWRPFTLARKDGSPIPENPGTVSEFKDRSKISDVPSSAIHIEF